MPQGGTRPVFDARESRPAVRPPEVGEMQAGAGENRRRLYAGVLFAAQIPNGELINNN